MAEKTKVVEVLPYNPVWKPEFDRIREQLVIYVGDRIITVEHVGSTSIKGLLAKPIIDIDLVMESYEVFPEK